MQKKNSGMAVLGRRHHLSNLESALGGYSAGRGHFEGLNRLRGRGGGEDGGCANNGDMRQKKGI